MTTATATKPAPATDVRSHFGFSALPFTRELPLDQRWRSPLYDGTVDQLFATVQQRMSAALIAPSGTGKTTVLRTLRDRLPEARYRAHYVKVTSLSKRDLCREIAAVIGLEPVGTYPNLVRKLQDHFDAVAGVDGLRPVLLLDEGHDMRPEVLAILRILTNFDMDSRLVLSIVIAGQKQLSSLLGRPELTAVRSRLAHHASLRLLSRGEARDYIHHRLRIAGPVASENSSPFDDQALDAVYEICRGNLRATDSLCRKSLEVATEKALHAIDPTIVLEARQRLFV